MELLVVLVILTLLVGLAGPALINQFGKAKSDTAKVEVNRLVTDLEFFRVDVGRFPSTEEGLTALLQAPDGLEGWAGPYLTKESQIVDPWGNPYIYINNGNDQIEVRTLGGDNAEDGTGENQDVSSLE